MRKLKPEVLVAGTILLGAFLRLFRLSDLPPGFFWDEAFDGFDALRVLHTLSFPVFFNGNGGREPLTIYLQALGLGLLGASTWALRVVPAVLGVLTIPAVYRLTTELYAKDKRAKWLGVLAAGMLAVSFWHVDVSRLSLRVIAFPLFSTIAIWFFWRAYNYKRWIDFVLSGVLSGLALYTYLAARLLPLILLAFVTGLTVLSILPRVRLEPIELRRQWAGLCLLLVAMLVVFAPLGIYFLVNPGAFFLRSSYISIFSSDPTGGAASLLENAVRVVRMFIDRGDLEWRHNLAGRPALDLLGVLGFWVGFAVALVRVLSKPRYLFLLIWLGANLASTLLSTEAPHFLRSIGALPAITILAADGLSLLWERAGLRWGWSPLVIAVVLLGGAWTFHDYFDMWASRRETFDAFDGPTETVLDRALTLSQTESVVLPLRLYGSPNMQFYLASHFPQGVPSVPLDPDKPVTVIAAGEMDRSVVVLDRNGIFLPRPLADATMARWREQAKTGTPIKGGAGQTLATEFSVDHPTNALVGIHPDHSLEANFGGEIRMFGYDLEPTTVKPGGTVRVTYYWQALTDVPSDYFVTSNLLDPHGESFGQTILEPVSGKFPTSLWTRGDIIPDTFAVRVPVDAHPGKYRFEVGLLDRIAFDQLLPLRGEQDRLLLDPIIVTEASVNPETISHPLSVRLGDPSLMTLIGYDLDAPVRAGESVRLTLYWRAEGRMSRDYSVFVHLVDAKGQMKGQQDSAPENGDAPTSWWRPGDLLSDEHRVALPSDLPAGGYILEIGVYDSANGTRLPIFAATGARQTDDCWQIPVEVTRP